jgi:hypothetical protein
VSQEAEGAHLSLEVPEHDGIVGGAGGDLLDGGAECDGGHAALVPAQRSLEGRIHAAESRIESYRMHSTIFELKSNHHTHAAHTHTHTHIHSTKYLNLASPMGDHSDNPPRG